MKGRIVSNLERNGSRRKRRNKKKKQGFFIAIIIIILLAMAIGGVFFVITNSQNLIEEGTLALENGEYQKAITSFEAAIKKEKAKDQAYRGMGIAFWELEEYEQSRDAFIKALEYKTEKTGTIYNFLAMNEMKLGNFESALQYISKGLNAEGNSQELVQEMQWNEISIYESMLDWENAKMKAAAYTLKYPEDLNAAKEAEFLETR